MAFTENLKFCPWMILGFHIIGSQKMLEIMSTLNMFVNTLHWFFCCEFRNILTPSCTQFNFSFGGDKKSSHRAPIGFRDVHYRQLDDNNQRGEDTCLYKFFVAFCSFFPCSLTFFHRGRKQKSGGRQQKSSRADKQHCFP